MKKSKNQISRIEKLCAESGVKFTHQRKIIADVISNSNDHPDANEVYLRSNKIDPRISLATVYRTIKLFEEHNVLNRIELGGKRARYEELNENEHHDHLIDIDSGEIIEFVNEEIESLQMKVAKKLGYKLVNHRMELFGKKISK
ncbi:MAG: transcriptional repressor [Pelagibacterales bacterium]|nr:transcriptional repressor [Pelagibacterales bacterium]OUU63154.1 MAG: transcriptional repressor [Alphaproteobacteria bacterium TMED62]|tara:strand:+ start:6029 stop:6460 length:432 start_codon:yes stop_codon:yes gene_type:complete